LTSEIGLGEMTNGQASPPALLDTKMNFKLKEQRRLNA